MSHSRVTRYEILLDFVKQICPDKEDFYKELLTFESDEKKCKNSSGFCRRITCDERMASRIL